MLPVEVDAEVDVDERDVEVDDGVALTKLMLGAALPTTRTAASDKSLPPCLTGPMLLFSPH